MSWHPFSGWREALTGGGAAVIGILAVLVVVGSSYLAPEPHTLIPSSKNLPEYLKQAQNQGQFRGVSAGAEGKALPRPASYLADAGYNYEFKSSPNFADRKGYAPEAVMVHVTAGGECGNLKTWLAKASTPVSVHFLICKDGSVTQFVDMQYSAWHAGPMKAPNFGNPLIASWWQTYNNTGCPDQLFSCVNPNQHTVGIELQLGVGELIGDYEMVNALDDLLLWLVPTLNISPDRVHVVGHYETNGVDRVVDPICCWDINRGVDFLKHRLVKEAPLTDEQRLRRLEQLHGF